MRVIGGSARGRALVTPKGSRVRPTADRIKEALFNILASRLDTFEKLAVLDIFSGTGNLGIEALSRGAAHAVFVDNHRESTALIEKNLTLTGFAGKGRIICKEATAALKQLAAEGRIFDLVFLDPPYRQGLVGKSLAALADSRLLRDEALIVAEHDPRETVEDKIGRLTVIDRRRYGDTTLAILTPEEPEQNLEL